MKKILLFSVFVLLMVSLVFAAEITPLQKPPEDLTIECQFYSYDEDSLIGNVCVNVDDHSSNCTIETTGVSSSYPGVKYYGSSCDFQVSGENGALKTVEGSCKDSKYVETLTVGSQDKKYARFYCEEEPASGIVGVFQIITRWFKCLFSKEC